MLEPTPALHSWRSNSFDCRIQASKCALWFCAELGSSTVALQAVFDPTEELTVQHVDSNGTETLVEADSPLAAYRVKISSHLHDGLLTLRCVSSILPISDLAIEQRPRDLVVLPAADGVPEPSGRVYAAQRGWQTGSLFASVDGSESFSLYYHQNFTSLSDYFLQTQTTPANSVGGDWPLLGFSLPVTNKHALLAGNEYVVSDALLTLRLGAPQTDGQAARQYLDALARTVQLLECPPRTFHDWPAKALATVFDLSQSPQCRNDVDGNRYLTPYVDDKSKPPESMVQLTVLVALLEYSMWSGKRLALARDLFDNLQTFVDREIGSIVRWLPHERFEKREDEHQTHDAMDSWYLYHVLFNLTRLATAGNRRARKLLKDSLPFAVRVAHRFGYRWPIFFNLHTLDIIQAEASKGRGGENDVAGLYALVMLHAYEIFDDPAYLREAKSASKKLEGLGFGLSYQTNTTGFAAEAMLRLALITGEEHYLELSNICLANIFHTTAIWERSYGHARFYSTFFSLYPLPDAPYVAAYEELEALAKFFEYLRIGGDAIPRPVKFLMCEYAKHLLSRGWSYYPGELPKETLAPKSRNGRVVRELAIPLEDLQDGTQQSGQVGQEVYGAGLALVCTTRHFHRIPDQPLLLFCEYPMFPLTKLRYRVAGDSDLRCFVRLISTDPNLILDEDDLGVVKSSPLGRSRSVEGHVVLEVRGGDTIAVRRRKKR